MVERVDVVIIGGGQSGLAAGYCVAKQGRSLAILEQGAEVGHSWRNRWDSLRLITPSPYNNLPGLPFPSASSPFPTKDETADYLKLYAETFKLPVRLGVQVESVKRSSAGYRVQTSGGSFEAVQVIVATGPFQRPSVPRFSEALARDVVQIHSSQYRNHRQLPPGDVLVVGSGNSGAGIAKDLANTHRVHLSVGARSWVPRRLLGRDVFFWLHRLKAMDVTIESRLGKLWSRSPDAVIGMNPEVMARESGVTLVGRTQGIDGDRIRFADGRSLRAVSVIWATGFKSDYGWIDVPVLDGRGMPIHARGVTSAPGLYFLGLKWQYRNDSSLLGGVGRDAAFIASQVAAARA
jgi:putative flavoprotein involved in K+ transport